MTDKNGSRLELGHDVRTPDGVGRISSFSMLQEICVRHYKEGSVVFTDRPKTYPPGDVEMLGQSLKSKLNEERFTE